MVKDIKYFVVTHFNTDGPAQFLNKYLQSHKEDFIYIEHPFIFAEMNYSKYQEIQKGRKISEKNGCRILKNELFYYLRDFLGTLFFGLKYKCQIGIGFDNLNAFSLFILKIFKKVNKVVYVTVDYTPVRFSNKLMNFIYHQIDKFCCYHADILWDSAEVMKNARKKRGVNMNKIKPIIVVDDGNDFEEEKNRSYENIKKYRLVHLGHLKENQGVGLLIDSVAELNQWNSKVSLLIIGGGEKLDFFKQYVKEKKLNNIIEFTGHVEDHNDVQEKLRECYLSFALYEDEINSFSKYSAVGKPKVYMGCGLPVIITDVPEIARKIEAFGAGKIVPYDKEKIVEKVKEIIGNEFLYKDMREKAIEFAKNNTWEKVFSEAFKKTNEVIF